MQKYFLFTVSLLFSCFAFAQKEVKYKTVSIQPKQTFYGIAREYGVPVSDLKSANEQYAPNYQLKIGDKLRIPITTAHSGDKKHKEYSSSSHVNSSIISQKDVAVPVYNSKVVFHEVKKGETLTSIAKANQLTVKELMAFNNFTSNSTLKIGQKIKISKKELAQEGNTVSFQSSKKNIEKKAEKAEKSIQPEQEISSLGAVPAPKPETQKTLETTSPPLQNTSYNSSQQNLSESLENSYNSGLNINSKKTIRGIGQVSTENSLINTSSILYNYAEIGDVVKVVNLMSKKVAYLKVAGKVREKDDNNECIIQILPETAKMINANENRFLVEVTSY